MGPLRRLLAAIAERLIATRAPERLCYARLGDYARERPGISTRQLQALARVHRALLALPGLERALVANELPWSKVRLVARVATREDEDAWIARARGMPTRLLEQEVRQGTGSEEPGDADGAEPEKRIDVCPELRDAYRSGRLSWVKAHCLLPLLLLDIPGEWRNTWVAWAERVRRLEEDVERALLLRAGNHFAWQRCKLAAPLVRYRSGDVAVPPGATAR